MGLRLQSVVVGRTWIRRHVRAAEATRSSPARRPVVRRADHQRQRRRRARRSCAAGTLALHRQRQSLSSASCEGSCLCPLQSGAPTGLLACLAPLRPRLRLWARRRRRPTGLASNIPRNTLAAHRQRAASSGAVVRKTALALPYGSCRTNERTISRVCELELELEQPSMRRPKSTAAQRRHGVQAVVQWPSPVPQSSGDGQGRQPCTCARQRSRTPSCRPRRPSRRRRRRSSSRAARLRRRGSTRLPQSSRRGPGIPGGTPVAKCFTNAPRAAAGEGGDA